MSDFQSTIEYEVVLAQVLYPGGIKSTYRIRTTKKKADEMVGQLYADNDSWFVESVREITHD